MKPTQKSHRHGAVKRLKHRAFATDFDGTLAHDGVVPAEALRGLERLREAGIKVLMVTGRELQDLSRVFSRMDLFDLIVAENGGLIYSPGDQISQRIAAPPCQALVDKLISKGVSPISVGQVVIATWEPHHHSVLESIKELGLELQVIFNKGAVMVLPSGVNKASGLEVALKSWGLTPGDAVSIGDAENDCAMFEASGFSVAVANALPAVKERASHVTEKRQGEGVAEAIDLLLDGKFESAGKPEV